MFLEELNELFRENWPLLKSLCQIFGQKHVLTLMMHIAQIDHSWADKCRFFTLNKILRILFNFPVFIERLKEIIDLSLSNFLFWVSLDCIEI